MYRSILSIVSILIIVLLIVVVKKRNNSIQIKTFVCVMCIAIFFLVEGIFLTFKTPESLFNYMHIGTIENVIYGDNSCMIYYSSGKSTYSYQFSKKTTKGYKIVENFYIKRVSSRFDESCALEVFCIENTDDYYIVGTIAPADGVIEVYSDNNILVDSDIRQMDDLNFIYGFIDSFTEEYYIVINGEKIYLK